MKILLILLGSFMAALVGYALIIVDDHETRDYIGATVCLDIAKINSARPSSVEVNNIYSARRELSKTEAVSSIEHSEAQLQLLDLRYENGESSYLITTAIDYSDAALFGSARNSIRCDFIDEGWRYRLTEISDRNGSVDYDSGIFLVISGNERIDIVGNIEISSIVDPFRYLLAKIAGNASDFNWAANPL